MVDVILSSDNVTVLGGPSKLDVDLNIGASGTRGSLFFVGTENPNNLNPLQDFPVVPIIFDIFINSNAESEDYLQAYQYVTQDGIRTWIAIFKLTQDVYSVNLPLEFEDGEASVDINLSELGLKTIPFFGTNNSFAYFNVQATMNNINLEDLNIEQSPIAFSTQVKDAYFDNSGSFDPSELPLFLPITFKAAEFIGSSWALIDQKTVLAYITISFANPNSIFETIGNNGGD
jgi:hypothetical protein